MLKIRTGAARADCDAKLPQHRPLCHAKGPVAAPKALATGLHFDAIAIFTEFVSHLVK